MVTQPRPHGIGHKAATRTPRSGKERGVVLSALVVNTPDISLNTSLQNLISFAVECATALHEQQTGPDQQLAHFTQCVQGLEAIHAQALTLTIKQKQLLEEFISDARLLIRFVEEQMRLGSGEPLSSSAVAALAGKTFNLQWISVCLGDELRGELSSDTH